MTTTPSPTPPESDPLEITACTPFAVDAGGFNSSSILPYGLTVDDVERAMTEFVDFLGFMNGQMRGRDLPRLETMLMPANFSSVVGEFMSSTLPKHCLTIAKNRYHNGHPDLVPKGRYPNDSAQHEDEGIEIKGSRYLRGWQGHNPEDTWLMVFVFDSNRPDDAAKGVPPKPFRFVKVVGARLVKADWTFSGRTGESRRTITASVNRTGFDKMEGNWIYRDPNIVGVRLGTIAEGSDTLDLDV